MSSTTYHPSAARSRTSLQLILFPSGHHSLVLQNFWVAGVDRRLHAVSQAALPSSITCSDVLQIFYQNKELHRILLWFILSSPFSHFLLSRSLTSTAPLFLLLLTSSVYCFHLSRLSFISSSLWIICARS